MESVAIDENELNASLCRESFVDFVREFWECVPGAGEVVWNWHIDVLCNELQAVAERVFKGMPKQYDEVFNVSPGTSKSTVCSILFPCWVWTRMPTARIMCASHTDTLVLDLANKARDVIRSEKYHLLFPEIELKGHQDTKGYYANTKGGDRFSCTVQGKTPTGFHAHVIIIDDPLDPKRALSAVELKTAKDFLLNYVFSRKADKAVCPTFLVMQRVHRDDPTGAMLENSKKPGAAKVRHIKLPARLYRGDDGAWIEAKVCPQELAKRYVDGLMDLKRLSASVLDEFRATMGAYAFAGQFDQEPVPLGGGMFKEQYFNQRRVSAPYDCKRVLYIDRASTQDGGCYTAMVLLGIDKDKNWYVEHVVHGQWEPVERNARIKAEAIRCRERYGPKHEPIIYVEAEGGSSGKDAWKALAKELAGFVVKEDKPTGSKDVRAEPWSVQLAAGNVWIIADGSWDVENYVREHCSFAPEGVGKRLGAYKDQVDASSGAFNVLLGKKSQVGGFQIVPFSNPMKKDKGLRIVLCDRESLGTFHSDESALLLTISDCGDDGRLDHALDKLVGRLGLCFDDVQPSEHQADWLAPIRAGKTCSELMMSREHGKGLWAWLNRSIQASNPSLLVIADGGDRRGASVGMAILDCLRRERSMMWRSSDSEEKFGGEAPNAHVYNVAKQGRSMVYG